MGLSKRVRGFTLIEVVLVIAVGLGMVVGGLVFYQKAYDRAELTSRITIAAQIQAYLPKFARENLDMARHQGHWKTAVSRLNAGMTHILPGWEVTRNSGNAFEAVFKGVKVSFF
ncbi:type II secretion system protein [uncultured Paracoccus sp.]|uniref:type II secretion system protein n=1 Tax=uncultured Paracoccus sp. TaxID=189685 RepID=UPI0025F3E7AF|nr:type II secretion system protein [uncultured Paracoccus sp.]